MGLAAPLCQISRMLQLRPKLVWLREWVRWLFRPESLPQMSANSFQPVRSGWIKDLFASEILEEKPERQVRQGSFFRWVFSGEVLEGK